MTDANRETSGEWRVSDSDNRQVVNENGVVVAQCERAEDARYIAFAPTMGGLCRYMAQDEHLDASHAFGTAEYVVSVIGEEVKEDDDDD
ncbi:MAG: hypothetical protein ACYYKD_09485 [Rhodospirillales bacterium]